MAFNPLKNRKFKEPEPDNVPVVDNDEPYLNDEPQEVTSFEGADIADLQQTGLKTDNLVNPEVKTPAQRQTFNLPLLEALSLETVLESFAAEKKKENLYHIHGNDISIKENKWFNTTVKKGQINAISLTKHILALSKNLDEKAQAKSLFMQACQHLNTVHDKEVQVEINQKEEVVAQTPPENPEQVKEEAVQRARKSAEYWKVLTDQLNNIPVRDVMEHIGANPNEDGQTGKWKVWQTGDNIQVTGQKWHSWKAQKGGIGGISLLAFHMSTIHNLDDRIEANKKALRMKAIKELIQVFGDGDLSQFADTKEEMVFKQPFSMPHVIDFKINQVRDYLYQKRGLPMWIINKQIKAGSLFAGAPSDWKDNPNLNNPDKLGNDYVWAVFLGVNGTAAEMRAIERTDKHAKILATGSDKEFGGFLLKAEKAVSEKTVATLEASIDSMSYHSIYPGRIVMSAMGVNFNLAVKAAIEALERDYNFELGFDNDMAGNEAAIRFAERLTDELGEEDYKDAYKNGKLRYFDLGMRCLKECIDTNQHFYLDVQDNDIGMNVIRLFQDQLIRRHGKEEVNKMLATGHVKYANVSPTFGMIHDIQKEAENVVQKLSSGKPYYFRPKIDEEDKEEIKVQHEAFMKAFKELAQEKYTEWEKEGKIIYKKIAIAKDWNEYYLYMKNKPEFQQTLAEQEEHYAHYNEPDVIIPEKKKMRKR